MWKNVENFMKSSKFGFIILPVLWIVENSFFFLLKIVEKWCYDNFTSIGELL